MSERSVPGRRLPEGLALIFDMDGVIVDSNPAHRRAWEVYNRRFGVETTEAMHQFMYGKRNDDIVRHFFGDGLPPEEVARRAAGKEILYRETIGAHTESMLLPGLRRFLEIHRDDRMAVASNAEPDTVHFLLDRTGLRKYFEVVVDGHDVHNPKPHPDIYLRAADLLGIRPADCIVFEDSHSGVAAALGAGMRVIGVLSTFVNLPGTLLTIDNFLSGEIEAWLQSQERSV